RGTSEVLSMCERIDATPRSRGAMRPSFNTARRFLRVVPANAGTHTPCTCDWKTLSRKLSIHLGPVVMGPCVRRDDVERAKVSMPSLRAESVHWSQCRHCEPTGRREAPPDDRLREAIQLA